MTADIAHSEVRKAAPLEPTSGSLHKPMLDRRAIEGRIRERMKQEDKARH